MEKEKNQPGEELLDIDEKGDPIKKEEGKKEKKSTNVYKYLVFIFLILLLIGLCLFFLYSPKKNKGVFDETTLKNLKLKNRVIFGSYFS